MSGSRRLPIIFVSLFTAILICNAILIPIFINKEVPEDPPSLLEQYGFDEELINAAYSRCLTMSYLESVLVLRHGNLVIEWYFNGGSRDGSFEIMSAAKSFMSTIFGIAYDKGYFPNLDRKIMDYFPEFSYLPLDARVYNVTIRHLLQMKAGFNFNDTADEWIEYSNSPNWAKYVLELGFRHDPGEIWWYSTIQTNLLSIILTKATGMSTKVFADSYLFNPLGISIDYWATDPQGYYYGGHGMFFSPRDLAVFGQMCLNYGLNNSQRIVSEDWFLEATTDYSAGVLYDQTHDPFFYTAGYGYQWWLDTIFGYSMFNANGYGGQFIFCIPELDLVVVTTAPTSIFVPYYNQHVYIFDVFKNRIVRAIEGVE